MFMADMETHTPTPVERFTTLKGKLCLRLDAEGPRYGIARAVDLLILMLITYVISLAELQAQQQACQDVVGGEPGAAEGTAATGGDGGVDRRSDAGAPDAGGRAVVRAAVAAVDLGAERDACIGDEGGVRAPPPCYSNESRGWPAPGSSARGRLRDHAGGTRRVFEVPFAKMGWRARVELCRYRSGIKTVADCCRRRRPTARANSARMAVGMTR
jgi:hypothetical protein